MSHHPRRRTALDPSDRVQAILVWCSLVLGGPVVTAAILAMNWSRRDSLARSQALVATVMYAVVFVVWFPMVIWTFGFRGSPSVLWTAWAVMVVAVLFLTIRGLIITIRADVAPSLAPPNW